MNPVTFQDDIAEELERWKRDCKLAQQRYDELQSEYQHVARDLSLQVATEKIENNRLRAVMHEIAGALSDVLEGLGKLK